MFFEFSQEQEMLRKSIREFAEAEVAPKAAEWDEKDHFPIELWEKLGEIGVLGIFAPEEFGGAAMGHVARMICIEEIARYSAGLAIAIMTHHLGVISLMEAGSDEQKRRFLPDLCSGKKLGGLASTEPGGGSDFTGQKATLEQAGNVWTANGRKCFITNHQADVCTITAVSGKDDKGRSQLTAFLAEKGMKGYSAGRHENKLGLRGSVTGDLVMDNVEIPDGNILGKPGAGGKIAMSAIGEVGRAGMSAICVGILRGCVEDGVKFANERISYGKPISKLQAVQFEIANARIEYEAARLLSYQAASKKDAGLPALADFSIAKAYSTEAAVRVSKNVMDLMGGYGVINEYAVGRYMRDALASIPSGGTTHIQKIIIAGDTFANFKA